jgi:hypothetical protein
MYGNALLIFCCGLEKLQIKLVGKIKINAHPSTLLRESSRLQDNYKEH